MVRLTDRPDMTLDVYRGRKTTMQHNSSKMYVDLRYLFFAQCLNVLYISTKFHAIISECFRVNERTRFVTDRQIETDRHRQTGN